MKYTENNRIALEEIARAAAQGFGYTCRIRKDPDDSEIWITIRQPKDDDNAVYPEVSFHESWNEKEPHRFEIITYGYGDHSIAQAQRVVAGLQTAIHMVREMIRLGRRYGLNIRNNEL